MEFDAKGWGLGKAKHLARGESLNVLCSCIGS